MRLALVLTLIGSPVWAKPKLCAPISATPRWVIAGKQAVVCFDEVCFTVSPAHGLHSIAAPDAVERPRPPALAEVREIGGLAHACIGPRCTQLGPNLQAAIAADGGTPELTNDGLTVVLAGPREAWDVRRDREISLAPPPIEGAFGAHPMTLDVVDGVMLAEWEGCAGPCAVQTLVDSAGKNIGHWFGAGQPIALDAHRVAIVPMNEDARFVVLDVTKPRIVSRLPLEGWIDQRVAGRLDATTVVVASETDNGWLVQLIAVPLHHAAQLGARFELPLCRD